MRRCDLEGKASVIYTLNHPVTGEVRYVGYTTQANPRMRLRGHISDARNKRHAYVQKWVASLLAEGLEPVMVVIEEVPADGDRVEAERRWIAHFRAAGARLANLTDGGDGCSGYVMTPEARAYISAHRKASGITPENRAKMAAAAKLVFESPEYRAKLSAMRQGENTAMYGKKHKPETLVKMSAARKANPSGNAGKAGAANAWARAVIVDGVEYPTVTAAAEALGLTQPAISQRIRRGKASYADGN
jgi:group I intron endonuclease